MTVDPARPRPSLLKRVWQSLEPTAGFSAEELAAYDHARLAHLHKYLRAGAPIALVGHLVAAVYFNALAPSSRSQVEWLHTMVRLHTIAACFVVVVLLAINTSTKKIRASRARTALFEAALRFYPLFGALMSANAQRTHGSYGFFVVCVMGAATAAIDLRSAALLYGAASGILAVAIALLQQDHAVRGAAIGTVLSTGVLGFLWSRVPVHTLVNELRSRWSEKTAREALEERVDGQVREIFSYVDEIARLNRHLDAQVQQRSKELSLALASLAQGASGRRTITAGTIVGSRFVVDAPLNTAGSVWLADDRVSNSRVVLRVAQASSAGELDAFNTMLAEIHSLTTVRHAVFVRTVHIDLTEDGFLVQALEYVPGLSIEKWVRANGAMPAPMVARFGALLAGALAEAHAKGIVHRSVTPSNIMLSAFSPGVRLLGFGTVRPVQRGTSTHTVLSGVDPEYVAPEYLRDETRESSIDGRADVYSLGLLLYYALSSRSPYAPTTGAGWLKAHMTEAPLALESIAKTAPKELCALIMRCLNKQASERPTAQELSEQLEQLANAHAATGLDAFVRASDAEVSGARAASARR